MADGDRNQNVFELRPLNLADILDLIVKIYRGHFGQLMAICAAILVPLGVMQVVISTSVVSGASSGVSDAMPFGSLPIVMVLLVIYVFLMAVGTPVMQAAVAKAIASYYLGTATDFGAVYRFALRKWLTLLWVMALMGLVVGGAATVCMIPVGLLVGVGGGMMGGSTGLTIATGLLTALLGLVALAAVTYFGTMLYFCGLVVVLEDTQAVPALHRSWTLVRGEFWRVFGTLLVLTLMVSVARAIMVYPVQLGLMLLGEEMLPITYAVTQGVAVVAQLLTFPLMIAGTVLLYYDLRIRKEGFDLVAMAEAIGQPELAVRTGTGEAAPALFGHTPVAPPHAVRSEESLDDPPDFSDTP